VAIFNRCRVNTATIGTGTLTLGTATSGKYCTFAEGGVPDGATVSYVIEEGDDFEIGTGVYTLSGTTLTRATVLRSKIAGVAGTTKMTLAGAAVVAISAIAEQIVLGPGAAVTNNNLVAFDGTSGVLAKDSGYAPIDEDSFASDSATKLPSQQSVKAYVDAAFTALKNGVSASFDTLAEIATELALKATIASPTFTGTPAAPTPSLGDNDTSIATTAFVQAAKLTVSPLTDGATPALDSSLGDIFTLVAAGNRTIGAPTGSPANGKRIIIRHLASGGARTLSLNTGAGGFNFGTEITGLTATASGTYDYIGCVYNSTLSLWDVVAYSKGYS